MSEQHDRHPKNLDAGTLAKSLVCALIGGGIGVALWVVIGRLFGGEARWGALAVGGIVGFGMAVGADERANLLSGVLAAVIALGAIAIGKKVNADYWSMSLAEQVTTARANADDAKVKLAGDVVRVYEATRKPLRWPERMTADSARVIADFPSDVWADVEKVWSGMSQELRDRRIEEAQAKNDRAAHELAEETRRDAPATILARSWSGHSLYLTLAGVVCAFAVGRASWFELFLRHASKHE